MEKYGIKIEKITEEFYPRYATFLKESESEEARGLGEEDLEEVKKHVKIDELDIVYALDGTRIDMKQLMFEMESAKTAVVTQSPEFAPYIHNFTPIYTWAIDTMATDGVRLFVNPKFGQELEWHGKIFVLIHEIMHCVLKHQDRLQGRDHYVFNVAGDYEINALIVDTIESFDESFIKNNINGLYDKQFLNWPAEKIYKHMEENGGLPEPPQPPPGGGPGGPPPPGGTPPPGGGPPQPPEGGQPGQPGEGEGEEEGGEPSDLDDVKGQTNIKKTPPKGKDAKEGAGGNEEDYAEVKDMMKPLDGGGTGAVIDKNLGKKIAEASGWEEHEMEEMDGENTTEKWDQASEDLTTRLENKSAGSGHGGGALRKALQILNRGDLNWMAKLRRFVGKALSAKAEPRIGNKKHLGKEYLRYAQKKKADAMRNIVVLVDVSGSMGNAVLNKIIGEINGIIFSKKAAQLTLAYFDDDVFGKYVQTIGKGGKFFLPKTFPAGRGTSFSRPLEWIKAKFKDKVELVIFFTDGYAEMPPKPRYGDKRFIWVVYNNPDFKHPFGRQINIKLGAV